jgi:hypothetical protein
VKTVNADTCLRNVICGKRRSTDPNHLRTPEVLGAFKVRFKMRFDGDSRAIPHVCSVGVPGSRSADLG